MSHKSDITLQNFNPYYNDNTLLIQFILTELLIVLKLCEEIINVKNNAFTISSAFQEDARILLEKLQNLLSSQHSHLLTECSWNVGPLARLKHYIEQFAINYLYQDNLSIALREDIQSAWHPLIQTCDLLSEFKDHPASQQDIDSFLKKLNRFFTQFHKKIKNISKNIPTLIKSFESNETVLFFLMRKENEIAEIYGLNFFAKWFKLSADKQSELFQQLKNKHEAAFEHLVL